MSDEQENDASRDDLRLCPTCRMAISVLATRCRYCGESVGRPRREEASFSIADLGGEKKTSYTVSGNVMDALEAFRAEEVTHQEQEQIDRNAAAAPGQPGLPELDADHRAMADAVSGVSTPTRRRPVKKQNPIMDNLPVILGIVIGVPVVLAVLWFGYGAASTYIDNRGGEDALVYLSPALDMLDRGEPATDALMAAIEAVGITDSPENRRILDEVRQRFIEEVQGLLNASPFQRDVLDRASAMTTKIAMRSSNGEIAALRRAVEEEVASYKLILIKIDAAAQSATFKLHNPYYDKDEEIVSVGDYVEDRFIVRHISASSVRLEDVERHSGGRARKLVAQPLKPVAGE